jgi:hypothetical protein
MLGFLKKTQGRGEGEELSKEKVRGAMLHKAESKT